MLYETFNSLKKAHGEDYFKSRIDPEIVQNLNPKFELREYQKEILGRFNFYLKEYQRRQFPAHLLFHMATGSGKTKTEFEIHNSIGIGGLICKTY